MLYRCALVIVSLLTVMGMNIAATTQTVSASQSPQASMESIDAYITDQMNELEIPGVAVGVVQGDQVVHLHGYGIADDSGRAMTLVVCWLSFATN